MDFALNTSHPVTTSSNSWQRSPLTVPWVSFRAITLVIALTSLSSIATAQEAHCTDGPEGRTCRIQQPLVNGAPVSLQRQQDFGLITVGGGCSGTLVNRSWVLTADHCVTADGSIGGPSAALANIPITAAWSPRIVIPTRLVRNWGPSRRLDIALIYLGGGDFGPANVQLFFVGDVDTSMTLTKFGRGIFAYASAGPPAIPAQQDGQYRTAAFTVSNASTTGFTLPINAANQVGNGGDSGGPDLVTAPNGVTVGIAGVQSTCIATSSVPGMPSGWTWVTAISSCQSASISTARFDILQIIQEREIPSRNSCASAVVRQPSSVTWGWNDGSGQTSVALFASAGTKFQDRTTVSSRQGGWGDDVKWFAGDFNNDGRTDMGAAWNNGGNNTLTVRQLTDSGVSAVHWATNVGTWSPTTVWLPGDFNKDGRTDVAGVWNDGGQVSIAVYLSDGTKFLYPTQWSLRDGGWGDTVKWFTGDFNNDGSTDIGSAWNNNGATTLTVRQSTGSAFSPVHWAANAGNWADASAFVAGDFDDDRRTDVARLWNDQGLNSISVSLSNGTSFAAPAAWSVRDGGWISGDAAKWFPGDFNGDGRSDIGVAWDDNHLNTLTVRQSTGSGFVTAHWATKAGGWRNSATWCSGQFKSTGATLEARADNDLTPRVSPAVDVSGLAAKGAVLASQDPLAAELRRRQPDAAGQRGFDIGMAAAEGQTAPGPGKDRIRDSLPAAEQGGFTTAVAFSLERNRNADFAARGAAIAQADPSVAAARAADPDVFYWLGFDIATGIFGDPALGAQGNTATGPGSMKIRDSLSAAGQRGFNDAVTLHLSRKYGP